ncbi:glycoside hydrolase [Actinotalea ferrariae]|uniref:glycoside hydrolase family 76 protein n=1 Tax=Actinotalea ferrariae TaxID=1386098 RepID=UPI001C8BDB7C|nr:glycoside hydrolase family 76 protein [Actinotalea ferrariae]MBX9243866.1 glycoside hydrolase [Actinotalea ferrariae]
MTTTPPAPTWDRYADLAHDGLERFFGTELPQLLNNTYPSAPGDNETFNYWWLAHVLDVRLDAHLRTGEPARLTQAVQTHGNLVERNGGSLFNDYFDDMLWFALATLRLWQVTGEARYLDEVRAIWDHVMEHGWNDDGGTSLAWRKQQLYYKNTPANGPLAILSARLHEVDDDAVDGVARPYLATARTAFDWITATLVDETGFVEDGINREQDGRIDTQWRFTYNQGLYVGAAVELHRATGDEQYLRAAVRTAKRALETLATDGVFRDEGEGGDEGLFKGVYYRYLGCLLDVLPPDDDAAGRLREFVATSVGALIRTSGREGVILAGDDWTAPPSGTLRYSTQLSAIMALEVAARHRVGADPQATVAV